ncbi:LysR family transcriptional regulator [Catellatospora paridis]|uniref:LysR family transcriptional regulator n=1 Tax=Catellatospora paridis TaxID=1617086 RepID=UPI0012D3F633|nr:LysR family transcriptional regulator [Catellatospora paridis]
MDLRKLEVFVTVATERSFTRAAERLRLAQSGVSTAVRALERDLGATLLDRTTQRVELTESGRALLPEAARILAAVASARTVVTQAEQGLRGSLRLGILYGDLTPAPLRAALAAFHAEHPLVELVLTAPGTGGSLDHLARLHDGSLELAVVIADTEPGIQRHVLATDEVVLACTPDHALADRDGVDLAELTEEPFIDFPPGWGMRWAVDHAFKAAGLRRRITVQMNDLSTILDLVRLGLGVAFVPNSLADDSADLRFLPVRRNKPTYEIALAAAERPLSPVARRFLQMALHRGL